MLLSEALRLYWRHHLIGKSRGHLVSTMSRLGDVREERPLRHNSFLAFVGDVAIDKITVEQIQAWANSLVNQDTRWEEGNGRPVEDGGLSRAAIDGFRRSLSAFWKWAVRWPGIPLTSDLSTAVSWPSVPKIHETPPKAISNDTAVALLNAPASLRDHTLIRLLMFTGLRAHEAAGLKLSDLHLSERYARVKGKGSKERVVIFDALTAELIDEYLVDERPFTDLDRVFVTSEGEPRPITLNIIRLTIDRVAARADILEPVSAHRLRHWWATVTAANGGNLPFIQDQMGHSDPRTTRRYSRFSPDLMRQQYDEVFTNRQATGGLSSALFTRPNLMSKKKKSDDDYTRLGRRRGVAWLGPLPETTKDPTRWRCPDGHEFETSYHSLQSSSGSGCPVCAGNARKTAVDFLQKGQELNLFWRGPDVGNNSAPTGWACQVCGYEFEISYHNLSGCPDCAVNGPKSAGDYHELADKQGVEWDGENVPLSINERTWWKMPNGFRWLASYRAVRSGLHNARKTAVDYHRLARELGIEWLGPEVPNVSTKTNWRCTCGRKWAVSYNNLQGGTGVCPECADKRRLEKWKKTEADYRAEAARHGFTFVGPMPRTTQHKTLWRCQDGHEWRSRYKDIRDGRGCPVCDGRQKAGDTAVFAAGD